MTDVLLPLVAIVILVLVNGVFVAAEFALVGANRTRLATLAADGSGAAKWLLAQMDEPAGKDRYIAIAQLGITLASIGLGMYGEPAVAKWLYPPLESAGLDVDASHAVGFAIALGFITFLHVVFGEMIPKALALQAPEPTSARVAPLMRFFGVVFRPMVLVLNWLAFSLMRLIGIRDPDRSSMLHTSKELMIVTGESAGSGALGSVQTRLINNIFELEDRTAEQLMVSRSRMRAVSLDAGMEEIARLVSSSVTSRYPVFDGTLDRIVGVLHIKDVIRARVRGEAPSVQALMRELPGVLAPTTAEHLLALFKRSHTHAALVVDEFGITLGFVTMDDLVDDVIEEEGADASNWISLEPDGSLLLDGEVTLSELDEHYGFDLRHEEAETVAGLVLASTGQVPEPGAVVDLPGHVLTVEEVVGLKIVRVRLVAKV